MTDEILYDVADGVGTVTLNRPQARNALTFAMYEGLAEILGNPEKHGAPKVFVVTGAGEKAFAAGTDIAQFRSSALRKTRSDTRRASTACWARWRAAAPRPSRRSPAPAPAAERRSPAAATCASRRAIPGSASRSRARSATACRWRTMPASPSCSGPRG
jgi:hypothetical protein